MGNCCSDLNKRCCLGIREMHIQEFQRTYKSLKFPANIAFTHDPKLFRIRNCVTGSPFILKRIVFTCKKDLNAYIKTLDSIIELEHDNILKIHRYAIEQNQLKDLTLCFTINIIIEPFEHTLQDEIALRAKTGKQFTDTEIKDFMTSLVDALEFLQLKGLSHGDLRPTKIYLAPNKKPKVMYLGNIPVAESAPGSQDLSCLGYQSPQIRGQAGDILFSEKMGTPIMGSPMAFMTPRHIDPFKADVYSFGLVVVDMMSTKSFLQGTRNYREAIRRRNRVIPWDRSFSMLVCKVVAAMLILSEVDRLDFIGLKKMLIKEEYQESVSDKKELGVPQIDLGKNFSADLGKQDFRVPLNQMMGSPEGESSLLLGIEGKDKSNITVSDDLLATPVKTAHEVNQNGASPEGKGDRERILAGLDDKKPYEIAVEGASDQDDAESDGEFDGDIEEDPYEVHLENDNDLLELAEKNITNLRKLVINIDDEAMSPEVIAKLSEVIGKQSNLNEIALALPKANLRDEGIEALFKGIDLLDELVLCYFDFRNSEITDKGLKAVGECILKKKKLIQLAVNLSDNHITEEGCWEIAKWFGKLKNLKSLALNIGGNKIKAEGVAFIGKEMGKMEELESLTVFLYTNDVEGKAAIGSLVNGIKQLKKLEKINLNLVSNLLGDEETEALLAFLLETEVEEVVVDMKDNMVSEEVKKKAKFESAKKDNVTIRL